MGFLGKLRWEKQKVKQRAHYEEELKKAEDVEKKRKELQDDYREKFANPYRAAELGYVDEIIEPSGTRARLIRSFELLANKRQSNPPKKHSNLPL